MKKLQYKTEAWRVDLKDRMVDASMLWLSARSRHYLRSVLTNHHSVYPPPQSQTMRESTQWRASVAWLASQTEDDPPTGHIFVSLRPGHSGQFLSAVSSIPAWQQLCPPSSFPFCLQVALLSGPGRRALCATWILIPRGMRAPPRRSSADVCRFFFSL
jgi:hypothetical protein